MTFNPSRALAFTLAALVGLTCVPTLALAQQAPRSVCAGLAGKTFAAALVVETQDITTPASIHTAYSGSGVIDKPACRVLGRIQPTADSDIRFEVWLPEAKAWNGRYQAVGGGGNGGNLDLRSMRYALNGNYAVSAQDNGHMGASIDSTYAIGHPEKVIDFGWRSLHEVALASKAIIAAYYGRPQDLALFNGCSTGGRQALALAQRFPADYDGIAAGAPANYWSELNALHAEFSRVMVTRPDAHVSAEKMQMVRGAVHRACGAIDGVIDDPAACKFDVAALTCKGAPNNTCLTEGEVAGIKARYADLVADDGTLVYPAPSQGAEGGALGSVQRYAEGFFADYVHQDRNWKVTQAFDWKEDLQAARHGVIGIAVAAENPDLSAFAKRGGKLIQWHGWHDGGIPSRNSVRYYEAVVKQMGADSTRPFYRLFLGTGVGHCGGGGAPDQIGGGFQGRAGARDAEHDVVEALVKWIKEGSAPDRIIATRFGDNNAVVAQRPWCVYPQNARWDGKGDRNKAESYSCAAAK